MVVPLFPGPTLGVELRQAGVRRGSLGILGEGGVKLPDRLVGAILPHEQQGALQVGAHRRVIPIYFRMSSYMPPSLE